jgi:hypothetical protein
VFVVGCDLERDPRGRERASEVLALGTGLRWHLAESGKTRKAAPSDAEAGARAGCYWDGSDIANTLTRKGCDDRMPDKERLFAVLQPVAVDVADSLVARNNQTTGFQTEVCAQPIGYRWQNDRDGLVEDGTAPFCRASAGSSGFHEMNHPVVLARDNAAHAAVVNMQGSKSNACVSTDGSSFTLNAMHGHDVHAVAFQACGDRDKPSISVSDTAFCLPANAMSDRGQAVAHALRGEGFDASEDGTGRGTPLVPVAPTLTAHNDPSRSPQSSEVTQQVAAVHAASMTVRRLTHRECERLQGFPDDYTLIPWRKKAAEECPDGPRYKALGNSMACNCMAWIGERIAAVEARHDR